MEDFNGKRFLDVSGNVVSPDSPNAYKYEKYIFDYFPFVQKLKVYVVKREEYEPVKDSAEKVRVAYGKKYGL